MRHCIRCKIFVEDWEKQCPDCSEPTVPSANMPAQVEQDTMKIEIASRGEWIRKMNEILGYDNSDGAHSEPCPHDLAKELRKFVQDVVKSDDTHNPFFTDAKRLIEKLRTPPV